MTISQRGYKEYTLDNGLVVALQNIPNKTVSTELTVNIGAFHEKKGEEGIAHFLEHCLFTGGSQKYKPVIADTIRYNFGDCGASTDFSTICFTGNTLSDGLEILLDYFSDHSFRPRFDLSRVNSERERVLREISEVKCDPEYIPTKEFQQLFYRGHPKAMFVMGKEEVISNSGVPHLENFYSRGFNPTNMNLLLAGGLPRNVEKIIEKYFGNIPAGKAIEKDFPKINPLEEKKIIHRYSPGLLNVEDPKKSAAQLTLAFNCGTGFPEDDYPLRAISKIFGEGTTCLLFYNFELKNGLSHDSQATYDGSSNFIELIIQAKVPATKINQATDVIFQEMERMKTKRVSNKLLESVKIGAQYFITKSLESNLDSISFMKERLNTKLTPELYLQNYNKLTAKKIQEVANKYLPDKTNGNYILYIQDPLKE